MENPEAHAQIMQLLSRDISMHVKNAVQQVLAALEYSVIPYCVFRVSVEYAITVSMGFCWRGQ